MEIFTFASICSRILTIQSCESLHDDSRPWGSRKGIRLLPIGFAYTDLHERNLQNLTWYPFYFTITIALVLLASLQQFDDSRSVPPCRWNPAYTLFGVSCGRFFFLFLAIGFSCVCQYGKYCFTNNLEGKWFWGCLMYLCKTTLPLLDCTFLT